MRKKREKLITLVRRLMQDYYSLTMTVIENSTRQTSLEMNLNGSSTHLQIGFEICLLGMMLMLVLRLWIRLCNLITWLPRVEMNRGVEYVSDQLKQLESRTVDGILDLAIELFKQNENLERSLTLQRSEIELLKEESLWNRNALVHLQQQMTSLTNRCAVLESNKRKTETIISEKNKRINELEAQISCDERSDREVEFPELESCPLLILDGRESVRDIKLKTINWLRERDNWCTKWREWIRDIVNWWGIDDNIPETLGLLYQMIPGWIKAIQYGLEMYTEFQGQLIRHYKFVRKLSRWKRKELKWRNRRELSVKIGETKLNKRVLEEGGEEQLLNLQSWLYNQTCGRVGVEGTMRKYLVTTSDGRVEWLKEILNLAAAKEHLEKRFKELSV